MDGQHPVSRKEKMKGKTVHGRNDLFDFRKGQNAPVIVTVQQHTYRSIEEKT